MQLAMITRRMPVLLLEFNRAGNRFAVATFKPLPHGELELPSSQT